LLNNVLLIVHWKAGKQNPENEAASLISDLPYRWLFQASESWGEASLGP
jgi:hypothetical protein